MGQALHNVVGPAEIFMQAFVFLIGLGISLILLSSWNCRAKRFHPIEQSLANAIFRFPKTLP